ncbi:MAG: glycosyltransferase family 39 protein [Acidobacteriia bacterium]|nr:glycosyltransferase family 39 protein [Terriglobia bacterium]
MPFLERVESWFTRFEWRIVNGLVILLVLRRCISPLPSSLWLDETAIWWASGGGFSNWVEAMKTTQFQQSPLYTLLMCLVAQVAGFNEAALRLPSVAAMTAGAVLLYRACRSVFGPLAALHSLLLWISLGNVSFAAADSRPYGVGLFAVIWSMHTFLRWLQTGKAYLVIGNGIAIAIAIYCSYFYGVILIAQAAFVLIGHYRRWLRMRLVLLVSPILAGLLLIPAIPLVRALAAEAYLHSVSEMPSWTDLGVAWIPPRWVIAAAAATGILALLRPGRIHLTAYAAEPSSPLKRSAALYWLALLAVAPALSLFFYSHINKNPVFMPRYFLSMTPALAVLGAYAAHCFQPAMWRGLFAASLFVMSFLPGDIRFWTDHYIEDWRSASAILRQIRQEEPGVMILAGSSFIESMHLPMPVNAVQKRWLLTPQLAYPIPGPLELLPLELRPWNELDVRRTMNGAAERDHFLVLLPSSAPMVQWTFGRFLEDYQLAILHANPLVVRFERRVRRHASRDAAIGSAVIPAETGARFVGVRHPVATGGRVPQEGERTHRILSLPPLHTR